MTILTELLESSILENVSTSATTSISLPSVLICTVVSLVLGFIISFVYMFKNHSSRNLAVALALLPAIVQLVIMLVNGNLGAGVAVLGAFSLVRFRSAQGSAKEITCIFFAMAVGMAMGMGYIGYAVLATVIIGSVLMIITALGFGSGKREEKDLRVTIPEDLDYTGIFDDLFAEYTTAHELVRVKTTNLGSLYELRYRVTLKDAAKEKEFLDKIRCRNGNLTIVCGKVQRGIEEL